MGLLPLVVLASVTLEKGIMMRGGFTERALLNRLGPEVRVTIDLKN